VHLFYKNKSVELFNALQVIRIQYNSGIGIQTIIKAVADGKYGLISQRCKYIMTNVNKNIELSVVLNDLLSHERNRVLAYLFNTMKLAIEGNIDLNYVINELEEQIITKQKENIEGFIAYSKGFSLWTLYIFFFPVFYLLILVI